jgi:hypothetical protein
VVAEKQTETPAARQIKCAKCGHRNETTVNLCKSCGSRLYISCRACGTGNIRSHRKCSSCGHPLHKPWILRALRKFDSNKFKIKLWQVLLFLIVVPLGFKLIIFLTSFEGAPPE